MRSLIGWVLALTLCNQAWASRSEVEPNDDENFAIALPLADEIVGQLGDAIDQDWYYFDVSSPQQQVTPVYFGCDSKNGFFQRGFGAGDTVPSDDITWLVQYHYLPVGGAISTQKSYVISQSECKRGVAETKGPFRFQLNTENPGRYYVSVTGRYLGKNKDGVDQFLANSSDYMIRLYTTRISGEMEPNDGIVEAFLLTAGNSVTGQLSSMYDQDWFYFDNDISVNTAKKLPISFSCPGQSGKYFIVSTYNVNGVLQSNYEVQASQCAVAGGFNFTIDAPVTARYYVSIASPVFAESASFTQADYSVVVAISNGDQSNGEGSGSNQTRVRKDGELEPNEDRVNAYPLSPTSITTAQLATSSDLDYYYIDNDAGKNSSGVVPIYFKCDLSADAPAQFILSTFNSAGLLQNSFTVNAAACSTQASGTGPFRLELQTPQTDRYYLAVGAPQSSDTSTSSTFSDANYSLSESANTGDSSAVAGRIRAGIIESATASNKDRFFFNIGSCGSKKGVLKLSGNRLNLSGVDASTQVKIQIGPWSCLTSPQELTIDSSQPGSKFYVYPKPVAEKPKPRKRTFTGTN